MKRNYGYDLIRIFAFLGVLLIHLSFYIDLPTSIDHMFSYGARGVQIFFCLSAFLAAITYYKYNSPFEYYSNRVKKILPTYYSALIIVIILHTFIYKDIIDDDFGLGWLRYFLGLNTAFPTNNFEIWSNINGFWTMGVTLNFYLFLPLLMKYFNSFNKSLLLFVVSFIFRALYSLLIIFLIPYVSGLDISFVSWSFFGISYQFILGIIAYWSISDGNEYKGICFFCCIILMGIILGKDAIVWGSLTSIFLIVFSNFDLLFLNFKIKKIIAFFSKFSFIVYLVHLFCYEITYDFLNSFEVTNNSFLFIIIALILIVIFSLIVNKISIIFNCLLENFKFERILK